MSKFKKQSQPLTALHEFAKNQLSKDKIKNQTHFREKSQFGLSTLLHFNNNQTISSIKSKHQHSLTISNPQFEVEAKLEIQQLKQKRLEIERRWKQSQSKNFKKIQSQALKQQENASDILDYSQVEEYNDQMQRTKYKKAYQIDEIQDNFIADLKSQILKDKGKQLISILRKIMLKNFLKQLNKYFQFVEFTQKSKLNFLRRIIEEWKQLSDKSAEREQLRRVIVQKIKNRKNLKEINSSSVLDSLVF